MTNFSGIFADIAALVGEDAALAIIRARGGGRFYLPSAKMLRSAQHSCWIVELLGREVAIKIADALVSDTGMSFPVPLGPMKHNQVTAEKIAQLLQEGKSEQEISASLHVARSTIAARRKALAEAKAKTDLTTSSKK